MLPIAYYFLKVTLCSGILFAYYWIFLRNKIYHQYNRFYLLASLVLSLALPLLKISIWQSGGETPSQAIQLLQVVNNSDEYVQDVVIKGHAENLSLSQFTSMVYLVVSMILLCGFLHVLYTMRRFIYKYKGQVIEHFYFVNTNERGTPFSFLNYIFWNDAIDIETTTGKQIFKHEVAHIREKHSYDKLFINILLIGGWINPFFWLIRKELNMIHEFVADKRAIADSDTEAFAAMILQAAYPQHRFELANNFFYSPVKRRLLMLTKNKNPKVNYFSRVLALPVAAMLIAAFSFKTKTNSEFAVNTDPGKKLIVVVDAGHGGKDAGGVSTTNDISEKVLTLAIAKKVKELNNNDNFEIILTRNEDIYQSPQEKAAFAKAQHADLFITIHVDVEQKDSAQYKSGMTVWVARDSYTNTYASKLFASSIIGKFQNNYKLSVSPLPQQRQTGIWVLQESGCPAVLIEAGFMSNQNDLAYLVTDDAKETFAKNILAAISQYAAAQVHDVVNTTDNLHTPEKATAPLTGYESTTVPLSNSVIKTDGQVTVIDVPSKQGNADGPLYIVDQKEIGYGNAAKAELDLLVNPAQISVVNVLKDKNAVDKYGDKGKNGVIEIVTKKNGFETTMNEKKSNELVTTGNITLKLTNAANTPLYVVDYVKIGTGEEAAAKINKIPPASIESMNVLKGKNATDKYGDQGRNGVIEIITKKKLTLQQSKAGNMNEVTVTGYPSGKIENKINSVINPEMLKVNLNGIAKSRRDIKSIKDAALLLPDQEGANVISFDVYFSGAAFPAVLYVHGTGNNLRAVAGNQLDRLKDGSVMIFDNVKVQIADGSIVTATSPGYVFYEASKNTTSKSQGTLDLALKNSIEPVQNHIYSVPLKVHLKNGSEINTYSMVGNGTFAIKANLRCYLNGKLCNNPAAIKKEDVTYMESYDAGAAEKLLGVKGASEVLYISTRS